MSLMATKSAATAGTSLTRELARIFADLAVRRLAAAKGGPPLDSGPLACTAASGSGQITGAGLSRRPLIAMSVTEAAMGTIPLSHHSKIKKLSLS